MNVLLHEPEIPQNVGNIGRTCLATNTNLHLIKPLGFILSDKYIKRAGMDYWNELNVFTYDSFDHFKTKNPKAVIYMSSTKASNRYSEVLFEKDSFLMFGKESAGIPESILFNNPDYAIRIPMALDIRSLNLSNSVAVVLYEALRQQGFSGLL